MVFSDKIENVKVNFTANETDFQKPFEWQQIWRKNENYFHKLKNAGLQFVFWLNDEAV